MTSTSILTDIELGTVAGGSGSVGLSFLQGMAAGAGGVSPGGGSRPNFGAGMYGSGGGSSKPCNSNHNGVHYPQ
jgi:hypothetical protein